MRPCPCLLVMNSKGSPAALVLKYLKHLKLFEWKKLDNYKNHQRPDYLCDLKRTLMYLFLEHQLCAHYYLDIIFNFTVELSIISGSLLIILGIIKLIPSGKTPPFASRANVVQLGSEIETELGVNP